MDSKYNLCMKFMDQQLTNDKISNLDLDIINTIKNNKYITIPEIAMQVEKSEPTIHRHLDILSRTGKLKRVGSRKTGYWEIL